MELLANITNGITPWAMTSGTRILAILVGILVFRFVGIAILGKVVRKSVRANGFITKDAEKKREDTIIRMFSGTLRIIAWLIGGMMILSELGINIGPILAAAGIAGLAFGFGGQYLIRDVISGLFIIFENQYRVGDVACLDGTCGLVEDISLRMTTLRDLDGTVHHVPNGEIKKSSNLSKYFARVNLDVSVSYNSSIDKVAEVVNRIGSEMAEDSEWKDSITQAPQFLRVDKFADSAMVVKILGETKPLKQWDVAGELRKRLKAAFDKEGIEIPLPQIVVHGEGIPKR